MTPRLQKISAIVAASVVVVLLGVIEYQRRIHSAELRGLRNQVASRDQTVEIKDGLYRRATLEVENLTALLETSRKEVSSLKDELAGDRQKLLTVTELAVKWKRAYEAEASAHQEDLPPVVAPSGSDTESSAVRKKVTFARDFGYIGVDGYTLTDPAYAWVRVVQKRPLVLTLALSQGDDGKWSTYVTSSEKDVGVDVRLSAVNPKLLSQKWYEKIGVQGTVAVGPGLVSAVGVTYRLGSLQLGPVAAYSPSISGAMYGVSVTWHPFSR